MNRNHVMDWMRGLAALWVVFFHLNEPIKYVPNAYTNFCKLGWLGVPVFFVISGWCMAGISRRKPSARSFLLARVLRIFPPFWASLFIVALAVGVLVAVNGVNGVNDVTVLPKSAASLLATISLTTSPVTSVPTVNWVYWSLSFEIAFYLLIAIGLGINRLRERLDLYVLLLLVFSLVFSGFRANLIFNPLVFWTREFPLFVVGWFGHRLFCRTGSPCLPLASYALALIAVFLNPTHGLMQAGVGVSSVLALGAGTAVSLRPIPILQYLGERSYSIYLIHVPLGCYLLLRFRSPFITNNMTLHAGFDLFCVVVIAIVSSCFFSWIERPSHQFAKLIAQRV